MHARHRSLCLTMKARESLHLKDEDEKVEGAEQQELEEVEVAAPKLRPVACVNVSLLQVYLALVMPVGGGRQEPSCSEFLRKLFRDFQSRQAAVDQRSVLSCASLFSDSVSVSGTRWEQRGRGRWADSQIVQVLLFQPLLAFRCICLGSLAASASAFAHAPQRPQLQPAARPRAPKSVTRLDSSC